jgi:peroxiredoxin
MATLNVNQTAPTFSLRGLDDTTHTLYKDAAQISLVVFFKTDCPTCHLSWPYFEKLRQTYRDPGLVLWGISPHDKTRTIDFAARYPSTFPILLDNDWHVSKQYDPEFVPTAFLIEPSGKIIDRVVAFDKAGLNRIAQTVAARLNVPPQTIAPDKDGHPPFKPG